MLMKHWALSLWLVVAPIGAYANVNQDNFLLRNTGDLIDLCSTSQSDPLYTAAANFCQGFIVGVYRVLNDEEAAKRSRQLFCLPNPPPTRNDGIAAFLQWAKADPGQVDARPADAIAHFLSHQYPCRRASFKGTSR